MQQSPSLQIIKLTGCVKLFQRQINGSYKLVKVSLTLELFQFHLYAHDDYGVTFTASQFIIEQLLADGYCEFGNGYLCYIVAALVHSKEVNSKMVSIYQSIANDELQRKLGMYKQGFKVSF